MADYRITFTIQGRGPDDEDFADIGFGSSSSCGSIDQAAYDVQSIIDNREWETEPGMPDPGADNRQAVSVPGQTDTE